MTRLNLIALALAGMLTVVSCANAAMAGENKPGEKDPVVTRTSNGSGNVAGTNVAPVSTIDKYKELLNRNLFSRNQIKRPKYQPPPEIPRDRLTRNEREREDQRREIERHNAEVAALGARGENDIVLMGCVDKDGAASAFLEDRRSGKFLTVKTGDTLAGGKVGVITIGTMEFIAAGKTVKVEIGKNLLGGVSSAKPVDPLASVVAAAQAEQAAQNGTTPAPAASTETKSVTPAGAPAPGDPNESIIEKMKRRKLLEGR